MRNRSRLLVVLALASIAAGPASQPTTREAAADFPALRKKVAELNAQVASLTTELKTALAENQQLKSALAEFQKQAAATDPEGIKARAKRIHTFAQEKMSEGMSEAVILKALGSPDRIARDGEANLCSWIAGGYRLEARAWGGQITNFRERGEISE